MSTVEHKTVSVHKTNFKKQKTLLRSNETLYNDKVPISTRFYLQLLKRSQFLPHFVDKELYEYASESEKAITSPEMSRSRRNNKKEIDRIRYNLRSSEAKTQRKFFHELARRPRRKKENTRFNPVTSGLKLPERNRKWSKEPLAPILEEMENRESLKTAKGSEIHKIAEKLKKLVTSAEDRLDEELLFCKESFETDLENIDPVYVAEGNQSSLKLN